MPCEQDHSELEALVIEDDADDTEAEIMAEMLQQYLIGQGMLGAHEVTATIAKLESPGMHLGAKIVAMAWTRPAYKQRLFTDGRSAVQELHIPVTRGADLRAREQTRDV